MGSSAADLHGMWYPTVRRTLLCLSRLYRCVDTHIFQGVSSEAVHACVSSLAAAAALITAGPRHADLFTIKHLLILREQLAPFTVECGITGQWGFGIIIETFIVLLVDLTPLKAVCCEV